MYRQGPVFGPGYSLPPPVMNPMMPSGCNSYTGCGLNNMANYINPGMYYGMNNYNNYGIYGIFAPQGIPAYGQDLGMQLQGYGGNMMESLGGANLGNIPLPLEQFVPMNFTSTNSTNILYGLLTNQTSPLNQLSGIPDNMFGQAITIDEETFKKLLGGQEVVKETKISEVEVEAEANPNKDDEVIITPNNEDEVIMTTTSSYS